MEAPTTNIPPKSTTVELERPLNTCFAGMKPNRPHAIAPAMEVIAKGISSVTKKSAITANNIKHLIAGDIFVPPFIKFYKPLGNLQNHNSNIISLIPLHLQREIFMQII
jgi:hypothetical protein